jgi:hypothetical protein
MSDTETISIAEATRPDAARFSGVGVPEVACLRRARAGRGRGGGPGRPRLFPARRLFGAGALGQGEGRLRRTGLTESPAGLALHVDAGNGFAYPALDLGFRGGRAAGARDGRCAVMAITTRTIAARCRCRWTGSRARGLIGLMVANAPGHRALGRHEPLFGTNPIAFAAPACRAAAGDRPVAVAVARGKVMNAKKTGKEIPRGLGARRDGQPTTDPEAALRAPWSHRRGQGHGAGADGRNPRRRLHRQRLQHRVRVVLHADGPAAARRAVPDGPATPARLRHARGLLPHRRRWRARAARVAPPRRHRAGRSRARGGGFIARATCPAATLAGGSRDRPPDQFRHGRRARLADRDRCRGHGARDHRLRAGRIAALRLSLPLRLPVGGRGRDLRRLGGHGHRRDPAQGPRPRNGWSSPWSASRFCRPWR